MKLCESTGTLTQGAIACIRRHSNGRAKAVKVSRVAKSKDQDFHLGYIEFEVSLSAAQTVLIQAIPGKIAAKVPDNSTTWGPGLYTCLSGHVEMCGCEVDALAASIPPGKDAVLVFVETYITRIGVAPKISYRENHPERDAQRCATCGSLTSANV